MTKTQIILFAGIVFLFSLCKILDIQFNKMGNLSNYADEIETKLHEKEKEIIALFQDENFKTKTNEFITGKFNKKTANSNKYLKTLATLATKSYNICLYEGDSLIFWTNDRILLDTSTVHKLQKTGDTTYMAHLPNGYFEVQKKELGDNFGIFLIPIKNDYTLKSDYLVNKFVDNYNIPRTVEFIESATNYPVLSLSGVTMGYLGAKGKIIDKNHLSIILWIGLLGLLLLGILVTNIALQINKKASWKGAFFLIAIIFILRYISYYFHFSDYFEELRLFKKVFTKMVYNNSLGDMLINTLLLIWLIVFFYKGFKIKPFNRKSKPLQYFLTLIFYFATIVVVLMVIFILQNIILDSDITINFDNVINFDFYSITAIISIVFILLTLFLYSYRMILSLIKIGLNLRERMTVLAVAILLTTPFALHGGYQIDMLSILIPAVLYVIIFDYSIEEWKALSLTLVTFWLFAFSLFTTLLLYQFNTKKEEKTLTNFANELSVFEDKIAEKDLAKVHKKLDADIRKLMNQPDYSPEKADSKIIDLFKKYFSSSPYLYSNYKTVLYLPHNRGYEGPGIKASRRYKKIRKAFMRSKSTGYKMIRFKPSNNKMPYYISQASFDGEENETVTLYVKTYKKRNDISKVYSELLEEKPYKELKKLDEYQYAVYKNKKRIDSSPNTTYPIFVDFLKIPEKGERPITMSSGKSEIIYRTKDDTIVVVSKNLGGLIKLISFFSYIFSILLATGLLTLAIIYLLQSILKPKKKILNTSFTLRNKIQIYFLGIIFASLIGVAIVAIIFFKGSSEKYHEKRLDRKVKSVLSDAEYRITEEKKRQKSKNNKEGKFNLKSIVKPISTIHSMDVNIYDTKGHLISSSETDIFDRHIIYNKMGTLGYYELSNLNQEISVQNNKVGDLTYKSAFVPLTYNDKTIAFLEVPYYSKLRKLRSDVFDFIGNLLNAFVILLILAIPIAIISARGLIRPLTVIKEKMKKVKLGSNDPIEWNVKDEIGDLVTAYNDMIAKVEESTHIIVQTERESTWRDMAQMVAHEIKTPLTPMKLKVQQFFWAKKNNRELDEKFIETTFTVLDEQIDAISNIVTEFSSFAKMPQTNNQQFDLNEVITSVYKLYKQNEAVDTDINIGKEPNIINADKEHIRRVLINLYQNAMQAIPDGKRGKIKTTIYKKDGNVIIKITDNGTGIPEDAQDSVFKPNFTTKKTGSGIGLAMSKNIIDIADGEIYFKTEIGKGTSFFVELPLYKEK